MKTQIVITGDKLYAAYNPKRYSRPWAFDVADGPVSVNVGRITNIRRHTDGAFTITGEKGKHYGTRFIILD